MVLNFLDADTENILILYWFCTLLGYLHSTMANISSDMYASQDWLCFYFSPLNLNLRVWLASGLKIPSSNSNTVSGLSRATPIEWRVIVHCWLIQFTTYPAYFSSLSSESGPWNNTWHFCLNCSSFENLFCMSQSNLGLLNCFSDIFR